MSEDFNSAVAGECHKVSSSGADGVVCRISISPQCGFASVFEGNPLTEEVGPTVCCTALRVY